MVSEWSMYLGRVKSHFLGPGFKWCMFLSGSLFLTFLGGGFKWCMFLIGF